jgi:hypothetical protein
MATHSIRARHNRPANDELHLFVYRAIIVLTIWLVLSIWFLFSRGAYTGLDAGVITNLRGGFGACGALAYPTNLLSWRRGARQRNRHARLLLM